MFLSCFLDNALRDNLTLSILSLLENGEIARMKQKWWNKKAKVCESQVCVKFINCNC